MQQVLCKKRDAVSHATFFEILSEPGDKNKWSEAKNNRANVLDKFWSGAVTAITER